MAWHARLSASTAERWINCPGSVAAIEAMPESLTSDRSSPYAEEGTAAHHLLEHCLSAFNGHTFNEPEPYLRGLVGPHSYVGGAITPNGTVYREVVKIAVGWTPITEDMADAVQVAIDYVDARIQEMGPGVELMLERQWDLTWLHPDLGGTSDVTLSQFLDELEVMDYKHGKGVVVDVEDNEQVLTYLLGAAKVDGFTHETYRLTIVQPRAPHLDGAVRSQAVTRNTLMTFQQTLKDAAEATARPNAPLRAGSWCRFCPKSGSCPAQDAAVSEAAGADFDDLPLEGQELSFGDLEPSAIALKLAWIPLIDAWSKGLEALAMRMAETGTPVPGYKLVQGKTNRRLRLTAEEAIADFSAHGLDPTKLFSEPKLKTPAQIEKLGKPFKALVVAKDPETGEFLRTYKPQGKVKLAPESDPRPAVDPASVTDFNEDGDEDE